MIKREDVHSEKIQFFENEIVKVEESIQKHTASHYDTLIALHKKVDGYKEQLDTLKPKIEKLSAKLHLSQRNVDSSITQAHHYLDSILTLQEKISFLQCFIQGNETIQKLERILDLHFAVPCPVRDTRLDLLIRSSSLYDIFRVYESRAKNIVNMNDKPLPFFKNLESRLHRVKGIIRNVLDEVFLFTHRSWIKEEDFQIDNIGILYQRSDIMRLCIKAYDNIGDYTHFLEDIFVQEIFREEFLKQISVRPSQGSDFSKKSIQASIFQPLIQWLETPSIQLIVKTSMETNPKMLHTVLYGIWIPISEILNAPTSRLFDLNIVSKMKDNYNSSREFLQYLEKQCIYPEQVNVLRAHSSYQVFLKKWNLQSFFYIRMNYIIENLESKVRHNSLTPILKTNEFKIYFGETFSFLVALMECWGSETFILSLSHNFLKLSFQILLRMKLWVEEVLTLQASGTELKENELLLIYNDISVIYSWISSEVFLSNIKNIIPNDAHQLITSSLTKFMEEIMKEVKRDCFALSIKRLIDRGSSSIVPNVKTIANTYRFTQRDAPTTASEYVTKILQPLYDVMSNPSLNIHLDDWLYISRSVVEELSKVFYQHATQLITSIQKTQDFLNRKKVQGDQSISDSDKMYMQLRFDILEFQQHIEEKLKLDPKSIESLQELLQATTQQQNQKSVLS